MSKPKKQKSHSAKEVAFNEQLRHTWILHDIVNYCLNQYGSQPSPATLKALQYAVGVLALDVKNITTNRKR